MKLINPIHLYSKNINRKNIRGIYKNERTGIQSEIFVHTLTMGANN